MLPVVCIRRLVAMYLNRLYILVCVLLGSVGVSLNRTKCTEADLEFGVGEGGEGVGSGPALFDILK